MSYMSRAKAVPAPKGNISYDSFRLYEALEVGAVPVAQNVEFWDKLFGYVLALLYKATNNGKVTFKDALNAFPT